MTPRVREILSWYSSENGAVLCHMAQLLNSGRLAGTGKLHLQMVPSGEKFSPVKSFSPNPDSFDPAYHYNVAIQAGASALLAPIGILESMVVDYAGELPTVARLEFDEPSERVLQTQIQRARKVGAVGVCLSARSKDLDDNLEALALGIAFAREQGLVSVVDFVGSMNVDKASHWVHRCVSEIGAHIVLMNDPQPEVQEKDLQESFQKFHVKYKSGTDRFRFLSDASLMGRRILMVRESNWADEGEALKDVSEWAHGGVFGSVLDHSVSIRPETEAIDFSIRVMNHYVGQEQ